MVAKILNLEKLVKKLDSIGKINLSVPLEDATLLVQRSAKDKAPVGTPESTHIKGYVGGRLKSSIKREPLSGDYSKGGRVFTSTEYAQPQEFGFSHTFKGGGTRKVYAGANNGLGYMRPAIDINNDKIQKMIGSYIKKELAFIANQ